MDNSFISCSSQQNIFCALVKKKQSFGGRETISPIESRISNIFLWLSACYMMILHNHCLLVVVGTGCSCSYIIFFLSIKTCSVLVPDLFRGDPWEKDRPKPLFEAWLAKQTLQRVSNDITMCTKWMMDEFVAAGISKKLGIIGFCFGGGRVIDMLAHDQGACFGIGVSFYGTRIDPSVAASVTVPVLFIAGDNDPLCPVSALEEVEKSSKKGLTKVLVFKGQGHGFAHRPQSPEEDGDAEKAFMVMRNWLYDGLVLGK